MRWGFVRGTITVPTHTIPSKSIKNSRAVRTKSFICCWLVWCLFCITIRHNFDFFISAPSRFTMEPELIEFLKKRGVPTSVIEKMEDNKVTFYYLKYVYMHWINWGLEIKCHCIGKTNTCMCVSREMSKNIRVGRSEFFLNVFKKAWPTFFRLILLILLPNTSRGGTEVAGWTVDRKIRVRFPAYPHRVWAHWWQGG